MYIFYILHLALYVSSEFAGTVKPITVGKYNYKIIMLITLQGRKSFSVLKVSLAHGKSIVNVQDVAQQ